MGARRSDEQARAADGAARPLRARGCLRTAGAGRRCPAGGRGGETQTGPWFLVLGPWSLGPWSLPLSRIPLAAAWGPGPHVRWPCPRSAFLGDAVDPQPLFGPADRSHAHVDCSCRRMQPTLFAFGLVLLLAGLRQLSLLSSAHARRGALARMAAINLMLLLWLVALVALRGPGDRSARSFSPAGTSCRSSSSSWSSRASASCCFARDGSTRHGPLKRRSPADPRPPVLYLRSFGVDDQVLVPTRGIGAWLARTLTYAVELQSRSRRWRSSWSASVPWLRSANLANGCRNWARRGSTSETMNGARWSAS